MPKVHSRLGAALYGGSMKNRFLRTLLALCLASLAMLAGSFAVGVGSAGADSGAESHSASEESTVHSHAVCGKKDCEDASHGGNIEWTGISSLSEITVPGNYYLKASVTLDSTWECDYNVNLCLNGNDIIGPAGNPVISVARAASLTITDCQAQAGRITHESGQTGRGVVSSGTLTLWNGSIAGNTVAGPGGVYNGGTFNMYGGSITGNLSSFGAGVYNGGTFNMTGGSITGNTTTGNKGGGVYNEGTLNLSGSVRISGNKMGDAADVMANNVYVSAQGSIAVTGAGMGENASVGITAEKAEDNPVVVTGSGALTGFFSDDANYQLTADGTGALKLSVIPVTISGVKLLVSDGGAEMAADESGAGTKVYDGAAVAYTGGTYTPDTVTGVELVYTWQKKSGDGYSDIAGNAAPSGAGSYRLLVTAKRGDVLLGELPLPFTISPKPLTVTLKVNDKTYDGTTSATATVTLGGVVGKDVVKATVSNVSFANKDAGENKDVTASIELTGAAADNYTVDATATGKATISRKTLTIVDLAVADKYYDGTTEAVISVAPELSGVESCDRDSLRLYSGLPTFSSIDVGKNIPVNFTDFRISGDAAANYTLTQPTGITANINAYQAKGDEYSSTTGDWTNQDFTVTAAQGWKVSLTNTADGAWSQSLTCSDETGTGKLTFYVRNNTWDYISEPVTLDYKIDKTAPTGTIRVDERHAWQEFVNKITFGLFFKDGQTVTIEGADAASGVEKIEYLVSSDDLSIERLKGREFKTYEGAFGIEPDASLIVYTRLTDRAGNVAYLRSDGIVLDATAPVISGAQDGKTYCGAVTLTISDANLASVTVNGNPVELEGGALVVKPAVGEQSVTATDKAGNATTLALTVNDGHTWGAWVSNGDGTHTRVCGIDATHTETAACHGRKATCVNEAVCADCGAVYGETDSKNHAALEHVAAKQATVDAEGNIEYWHCTACGKYFADAAGEREISQADTVIGKLDPGSADSDGSQGSGKGKKSSSRLPGTGDPFCLAVPALLGGAGIALVLFGRRKKETGSLV